MKKLLSGSAVFMFVLVIMAGNALAVGVPVFTPDASLFDNIMATVFLVIAALLSVLR